MLFVANLCILFISFFSRPECLQSLTLYVTSRPSVLLCYGYSKHSDDTNTDHKVTLNLADLCDHDLSQIHLIHDVLVKVLKSTSSKVDARELNFIIND